MESLATWLHGLLEPIPPLPTLGEEKKSQNHLKKNTKKSQKNKRAGKEKPRGMPRDPASYLTCLVQNPDIYERTDVSLPYAFALRGLPERMQRK